MKVSTYSSAFVATVALLLFSAPARADLSIEQSLKRVDVERGIVALLGLPNDDVKYPVALANASELTIYVQLQDEKQTTAVREAAEAAGLLGQRIFVAIGDFDSIHLANNVADGILVADAAKENANERELLRALRPRGFAILGDKTLTKPVPEGIDEWSHPYHGPDNNPQSNDKLVRGEFRTQFLGFPKFSPMPEQSVIAGGRIYKAMGHIAHKSNQNAMLNTLLCINAYNGTILWKRPLPPGFMIHRNTMIATDDALYLGDHESCKVIDGRTGKVRNQFTVPKNITDGPVWKWMAMKDGILYALVGNPEIKVGTKRSDRRGLGHWPWGMWEGHDYKDPRTAFGYGRTLVAIDLKSKDLLWHYRDKEFLDARGVCMNDEHIFCFSPGKSLTCIKADSGSLIWKNSDKNLLDAVGANTRAQHYVTGYATTCYSKCTDKYIFFAGPQRNKMVVASADGGKLLWSHPHGNLQLVLRDDAIYAAGPRTTGVRLDYKTGKSLGALPTRRACTRATGCADSIFYRTSGGTVRLVTEKNQAQHIAPMRPPCQDGVLISNGHLYWGPWMCGCQLSFYGNIGLAPQGDAKRPSKQPALIVGESFAKVKTLAAKKGDWTTYRGSNARADSTTVDVPNKVALQWTADVANGTLPTAPVVAGGMVFVADRAGAVRALNDSGKQVWKNYTSGAIYFAPVVANDRVYVGSADGRVYAYEAATGRFLWSHRVGPRDQRIPVYEKLISSWPVAGGVVVNGDTVYAAAGIAHYDGTHVVALDAVTGKLKAENRTSGSLSEQVNSGMSMQGNLTIVNGELRFLAGGIYETARYELETLKCLNTPKNQVTSQFRTAFYPYYPSYGKFVSLDHTCDDKCTLTFDASYEGNLFTDLALNEPLPPGVKKPFKEAARWNRRRGGPEIKSVWQDKGKRRFTSFVISPKRLVATGHPDLSPEQAFLVATNIKDGTDAWVEKLPADAVKGGTSIDHQGRLFVALENGQLLCFGPSKK
jgi:outer membrane protein assembly factor BamB